ncbi:MAG: ABC transporter ATP-binding protein [Cyanothece sp. SIO1E1]|nr:ABC transporter ATP-binding protein [Cyanothece sp. SIO1E1]
MGDEITISLQNVSKCFKQYAHPADRLKEILLPGKSRAHVFWALRDISLEVFRGQTLGIVGRNGSGKSTLLQLIVGTLTPTSGEIKVNGRISALLELGSGFNPEFTGRQNVFFNGQILGLKPQEIEAKFDEIAAFADIGDFIDQPVKTYSSGMFVRLAFAVAINAEPDVLIVDEALSVGDEAFQRKCFSRIKSIQEGGGTILFVSHAAAMVIEFCDFAVLIDHGEKLLFGPPKLVVTKYQKLIYAPANKLEDLRQEIRDLSTQTHVEPVEMVKPEQSKAIKKILSSEKSRALYDPNLVSKSSTLYIPLGAEIKDPLITTLDGKVVNILIRNESYIYSYSVRFKNLSHKIRFGMLIKTISGLELGGAVSHTANNALDYVEADSTVQVEFKFSCHLLPGTYFLNAGLLGFVDGVETFLHRYIDATIFRVQPEENTLATAVVDFQIESKVLINPMVN